MLALSRFLPVEQLMIEFLAGKNLCFMLLSTAASLSLSRRRAPVKREALRDSYRDALTAGSLLSLYLWNQRLVALRNVL